ncbi:hypothetical protein P7K49_012304 [Saguinus oedipus]|uniref:Uncharacterized protein n=1 Tax=Saguinus oedipus TaxID=9490 RepID=A0ABQ9VTD4_SAGOE|nr:hypothetical protein P7K49_012304 [Saguinus oedipus]
MSAVKWEGQAGLTEGTGREPGAGARGAQAGARCSSLCRSRAGAAFAGALGLDEEARRLLQEKAPEEAPTERKFSLCPPHPRWLPSDDCCGPSAEKKKPNAQSNRSQVGDSRPSGKPWQPRSAHCARGVWGAESPERRP